jgi:metal-responsive CopG/Arc/MetJ family transcriptional regulator
MHARMTISIQDTVYAQFTQLVPAKKRSQYIEQLIADAMHKEKLAARDAECEAMANDPQFITEQAFFIDFNGDIGNEPW